MNMIEYKDVTSFMFAASLTNQIPRIHWRDGVDCRRGFIWFTALDCEAHVFYSDNKDLLDAIWNSIGLIKRAVKLVEEVKL